MSTRLFTMAQMVCPAGEWILRGTGFTSVPSHEDLTIETEKIALITEILFHKYSFTTNHLSHLI